MRRIVTIINCQITLLLLLLIACCSSVVHLHFSPDMLAEIADAVANAPTTFSLPPPPEPVNGTLGIASPYFYGTLENTTCAPPQIARLFVPFGACFKNYIGNQPNCSVVRDCLRHNDGTFDDYTNCLTPTVYLFTTVGVYNDTGYLVRLFVDDACTTPFVYLESLVIPFGCQPAQIYDAASTFCGIAQNIAPSNNTAPASDAPRVAGIAGGVAALAGIAVGAIATAVLLGFR